MIKSSMILLTIISTAAIASNDQLRSIGYYHENGVYEPGYVNYRFDETRIRNTAAISAPIGGGYDDNGISEPGYQNYRFNKTRIRDTTNRATTLNGYYDSNGIFEPGYLNYRFGQSTPAGSGEDCQPSVTNKSIDTNMC
jgi:hypothetical protein